MHVVALGQHRNQFVADTSVIIIPAIGMITESDKFRIILNMLPFHPCGVCPT